MKEKSSLRDRFWTSIGFTDTLSYQEHQEPQRLIHVCPSCGKVKNEKGEWRDVGYTIDMFSSSHLSHGICPQCRCNLQAYKSSLCCIR